MTAEITKIYKEQILPRLDYLQVLAPLKPRAKSGDKYALTCPQCGEPTAFIFHGRDLIGCNRARECGAYTELLSHLNGGNEPDRRRWVELVKELGKSAGVQIPDKQFTPEQIARFEQRRHEERVLQQVLEISQGLLHESAAENYLVESRGITKGGDLGLGHFDQAKISQVVKYDDLKLLGLHSLHWDNRLVIPLRDRYGSLRAITGRLLSGQGDKFLKTLTYNPKEMILEGLDEAFRHHDVLIGESSIAIFSFRQAGLTQMTAAGTNELTADQWQGIADLGIRRVTVWFDNDAAGLKGTRRSIHSWLSLPAQRRPELFIVRPEWVEPCGDPDEFLRKFGVAEATKLIDRAVSANMFMATELATNLDLATPKGRSTYRALCVEHFSKMEDKATAWDEFFVQGVSKVCPELDPDVFIELTDRRRKEHEKKHEQNRLKSFLGRLQDAASADSVSSFLDVMAEARQTLESISEPEPRPLVRTSQRLEAHARYLASMRGKEFLGLPQKTLPLLDQATKGLRGLILVAAAPGAGKTTFVQQICTDVLKSNANTCCLFVSLEMPEEIMLNRLISRETETPYDVLLTQNTDAGNKAAARKVREITDRLFIIDDSIYPAVNAELIIRDAKRLKEETGCDEIIIAVDYIQKLPLPPDIKKLSDNLQDDWRMSQLQKIRRAIWPCPLVAISAINKTDGFKAKTMSNLKGSGTLAFDGDMILLINKMEDDDLIDRIVNHGKKFNLCSRENRKKNRESKRPERDEKLEMLREALERSNKELIELTVDKVRGGTKKTIYMQHLHTMSDMMELWPE